MKRKKLTLLLMCGALFLGACSKSGGYTPQEEPEGKEIFDDLDLGKGEDISLTPEQIKYHSNQDYDVGQDYKIDVKLARPEGAFATYSMLKDQLMTSPSDMLSVEDRFGNVVDVQCESKEDEDGEEYFQIYPTDGVYEEGSIMSCSLSSEAVYFKDRDPNLDKLYFNIPRKESSLLSISQNTPFYDIYKVTYFPVADGDYPTYSDMSSQEAIDAFNNNTYHFGYQTNLPLQVDQQFGISIIRNGEVDLSHENTFYGKFVSSVQEGDHYRITFKNADISEIFKDDSTGDTMFDFQQKEKITEFKNVKRLMSNEQLKEHILQSEDFQLLTQAIAEGTDNALPTILSLLSVSLDTSSKDGQFKIQLKLSGRIPYGKEVHGVKENAIQVSITFQWTMSFECEGGVKVKKWWGIPYDIDAHGTVTKITDFKLSFSIQMMKQMTPEKQDEEAKKPVKDRIQDAYKKLKEDKNYFRPGDDKEQVSGNHSTTDLLIFEVPFGYVFSFKIALSWEMTIDMNVMFNYGYSSHTVEKALSFDTDDGVENTSNTTECNSSSHSLGLGGELYAEGGFKLSISLGIVGLRKLFQIGGALYFGFYFDIHAMGGITFGEGQPTSFYGGFKFEVGLIGKISVYLDLLMVFHWEYNFASKKWPLKVIDSGTSILGLKGDDFTLEDYRTSTSETPLLTVSQFTTDSFSIDLHTYKASDKVVYNNEKISPLTVTSKSPYLSIDVEASEIVVNENAPAEFDGVLTVTVHPDLVCYAMEDEPSKDYNVHFRSKTANRLYFGDDNSQSILVEVGKEVQMPMPVDDRTLDKNVTYTDIQYRSDTGSAMFNCHVNLHTYDFLYYTDGINKYSRGDTFVMPNHDVHLSVSLYEITYYHVRFYNGYADGSDPDLGLIKDYEVREYTAAPEPTLEECQMDGYIFYGWDRDFSYVTSNMNVYGIYVTYYEG